MHRIFSSTLHISIGVFVFHLSGCSVLSQIKPIEISGLVIQNNTSAPIYNVQLWVEKTGTVVHSSSILAGNQLSTEFPLRRYQGNSVNISWEQEGKFSLANNIIAQIPDNLDANKPSQFIVIINSRTSVSMRLMQ